jgi:hypothetical protein
MALYPNLVTLGTINSGATVIQADVSQSLGSAVPVEVTLTTAYTLVNPRPPGFPFRPSMTGAPTAGLDYPRTLSSGTVLEVLQVEATALINAGAATLG